MHVQLEIEIYPRYGILHPKLLFELVFLREGSFKDIWKLEIKQETKNDVKNKMQVLLKL